jgi:hypothetical protein
MNICKVCHNTVTPCVQRKKPWLHVASLTKKTPQCNLDSIRQNQLADIIIDHGALLGFSTLE